jgi:hypothetical protein
MGPDDGLERRRVEGLGQPHALDAGVVDQDVEPALVVGDRREQGFDRGPVAHIGEHVAHAGQRIDRLAQVGDDRSRPLGHRTLHDGGTDAAGTTGDQDDAALEPSRHGPLPSRGARRHRVAV